MSAKQEPLTHIVVIDDDTNARELLSAELLKPGVRITALADPKKIDEVLEQEPVDLVISDIVMPQLDGMGVLEKVKAKDPGIEVIVITGYADIDKALEFMRRGAFDYLAKPIRTQELILRVEKAMEQRRLKLHVTELKSACEAIEKSSEKQIQAEKLASLSRLVSGMAHEINNPLTAVIGYSQLLLDSGGQDMGRQLGVIRDQAMRCGKIIQDLLGFARKRKPQFVPVNICEMMNISLEMVKSTMDSLRIRITKSYSEPQLIIQGDGAQLQKIFCNLISNSIHAVENQSGEKKIEVRIASFSGGVEIRVADNGCGISEEHLPRIYEPFFTTKEVGKGSGLGLSLCYGFVADHGGTIAVESNVGQGTAFTIRIPTALPSQQKETSASKLAPPAPPKKKSILIVEDEEVVAGFVQTILSGKGYMVEMVHDGQKALQTLLAKDYDIILCDFRIPKMNGFELFEKVQKEKLNIGRHFIFVTASLHFAQNHGGEEFFAKHRLAYLQKPFTAQDLTDLIEKRLQALA